MRTTQAPNTPETMTVNLPDWSNSYRTTPKPIYIPRYTPRLRTTRSSRPIATTEKTVTKSLYEPWNPVSASTKRSARYTTKEITHAPTTPRTTTLEITTQEQTTTTVQNKTLRIQPGTILMMDSEYLKERYIKTGLATTFHRALLADYFGLSEEDMKRIGMTVVAWGFSYQVKDKATSLPGQAQKYFCDFKFRSSTFNAGSVGADINIGIVKLDG